MSTERFVSRSLYLSGGLLIWTANFLVTYVFAALACARGFAQLIVAGLGVIPLVTLAESLASLAGCAWLLYRAVRGVRAQAGGAGDTERFIHVVAGIVAALSMIAIAWTAMVVSGMPSAGCGQ